MVMTGVQGEQTGQEGQLPPLQEDAFSKPTPSEAVGAWEEGSAPVAPDPVQSEVAPDLSGVRHDVATAAPETAVTPQETVPPGVVTGAQESAGAGTSNVGEMVAGNRHDELQDLVGSPAGDQAPNPSEVPPDQAPAIMAEEPSPQYTLPGTEVPQTASPLSPPAEQPEPIVDSTLQPPLPGAVVPPKTDVAPGEETVAESVAPPLPTELAGGQESQEKSPELQKVEELIEQKRKDRDDLEKESDKLFVIWQSSSSGLPKPPRIDKISGEIKNINDLLENLEVERNRIQSQAGAQAEKGPGEM